MRALDGIRVIDLTTYVFAPACSAALADWGAEVIKVEDITGDPIRRIIPSPSQRHSQVDSVYFTSSEVPWPFELTNRGKKGLTLDLRQEEGKQVMYKLVQTADVFISNLRNSALGKLRMDYETLTKINPRLIYAHGSGYGERGDDKERPGFDYSAFWARSGIMAHLGQAHEAPPMALPGLGDMTSGLYLAGGIVLALYVREKTGMGQEVTLSLLGSALWTGAMLAENMLVGNEAYPRLFRKQFVNPLWCFYQASDGKWLQLVCQPSQRYWPGFCQAIGRKDLIADSRFSSQEARKAHNEELISIIDEILITKSRQEWGDLFNENGVIWAPVQTIDEVVTDSQVLDNGYIVDVEHVHHGKIKLIRTPTDFSRTPPIVNRPGPELGQHNEEILLALGYSRQEIEKLREKKVII